MVMGSYKRETAVYGLYGICVCACIHTHTYSFVLLCDLCVCNIIYISSVLYTEYLSRYLLSLSDLNDVPPADTVILIAWSLGRDCAGCCACIPRVHMCECLKCD